MDRYRDSEILRMLIADGLSQDRAGTRKLARKMRARAVGGNPAQAGGMKGAGVSHEGDTPRVAGWEGTSPIYLAWSNPAANTKGARRWTHLVLIDGGKR